MQPVQGRIGAAWVPARSPGGSAPSSLGKPDAAVLRPPRGPKPAGPSHTAASGPSARRLWRSTTRPGRFIPLAFYFVLPPRVSPRVPRDPLPSYIDPDMAGVHPPSLSSRRPVPSRGCPSCPAGNSTSVRGGGEGGETRDAERLTAGTMRDRTAPTLPTTLVLVHGSATRPHAPSRHHQEPIAKLPRNLP